MTIRTKKKFMKSKNFTYNASKIITQPPTAVDVFLDKNLKNACDLNQYFLVTYRFVPWSCSCRRWCQCTCSRCNHHLPLARSCLDLRSACGTNHRSHHHTGPSQLLYLQANKIQIILQHVLTL